MKIVGVALNYLKSDVYNLLRPEHTQAQRLNSLGLSGKNPGRLDEDQNCIPLMYEYTREITDRRLLCEKCVMRCCMMRLHKLAKH